MTLAPSSLRRSGRLLPATLAIALLALAALAPGALGHPFHPGADVADTSAPGLALQQVGTFAFPVYVTSAPGDHARQFVVEQSGQIRIIKNGQTLGRPFLDISSIVEFDQGERGLLSMAFAPDYATSRRFYVFYTERGGDLRVDEFRRSGVSPDLALLRSRRRVIESEHSRFANHNGGQLVAGRSGSLLVSTGDGGGGGDPLRIGQNLNSRSGRSCASIRAGRPRRGATRSRAAIPSSAASAATRSGTTGCETRGGSRSTALTATWRSGTSARTGWRRSTSSPGRAAASTSDGAASRGHSATGPVAGRPVTGRRCSSTPTTEGRAARSPAATSCAIGRCRGSTGATSTATTAPAPYTPRRCVRAGPRATHR